ncbi:immunoglobulin I-set domain protein [Oesophagostomum dentatum]|uniref:Immunoglobulin I-set domain protein n=1 Tax=Oesophagostomum dentatum TaxID=61180 RepID=A0A0B1TSP4_OESDE|nr:immunoglobulin I-set domain protein [Oesophagostomum dentatum]
MVQINNITLQDKGIYTCIAQNVAGNDTVLYNVDVVRTCKQSLQYISSSTILFDPFLEAPIISNGGAQQVIEGELARIECLAEGHPTPIISWLRNGIRVETGVQGVRYIAEGKVLNVIEARSSDSGIYVCAATNEAGTAQQAYTLEVLGEARFSKLSFIIAFFQSLALHISTSLLLKPEEIAVGFLSRKIRPYF